ncbi:MAG: hypothetical protein WD178_03515, partial [Actinomycetota bacterium]
RVGLQLNLADLVSKWRAFSPARSIVSYWASLAVLVVLAGLPFVLLAWAAPSSEEEAPAASALVTASTRGAEPDPSPGAGVSAPPAGPTVAAAPVLPDVSSLQSEPPNGFEQTGEAQGADFDIRCWPTITVVPGGRATVECSIPVFHGDGSDISLDCRAEGMTCEMSPRKVQAASDNRTHSVKLTVTAPGSASVGMFKARAVASGGETGSSMQEADVDVNVPPPFSVSCESIGAAFVRGADARIKCWVSFAGGFSDEIALSVSNSEEVPAAVDTSALKPAPDQTRAFTIELDTGKLESRSHVVRIRASSVRYVQDAVALFHILPE